MKTTYILSVYGLLGMFVALFNTEPLKSQEKEPIPLAKFRVLVDKEEIFEGECFSTTFTVLINDYNRARLQFSDAGTQLYKILDHYTARDLFYYSGRIKEIVGSRYSDKNGSYTRYDLWTGMSCPNRPGVFAITSYGFDLLKHYEGDTTNYALKSLPLEVQVKPLSNRKIASVFSSIGIPMIGDFKFEETQVPAKATVSDSIPYSFTLSGEGNGFPLGFENPSDSIFQIVVENIVYSDRVSDSTAHFSKRFDLTLLPRKEGVLNLSDHFQWTFYSSKQDSLITLESSQSIHIKSKNEVPDSPLKLNFESSILICLDISESMLVQDYSPNRLSAAVSMLKSLKEKVNNAKLVGYSGSIHTLSSSDLSSTDSLFWTANERGTSLGNMIWQSVERMKHITSNRHVIIIGDGDGTSGNINELAASDFAKENNLILHTIGIGHTGEVPYGKDFYGKTNYVTDTYDDNSLREIARLTGGSFHYLRSQSDIPAITESILRKINK